MGLQPREAILCVFIVDMTLHLFEMMYKKCNRTGSDEVELSHQLAGLKNEENTNQRKTNKPGKSKFNKLCPLILFVAE